MKKKLAIIALDVSGAMPVHYQDKLIAKTEKSLKGFKIIRLIFSTVATEVKSFSSFSVAAGGGTDYNSVERFIVNNRQLDKKTFKYSYPAKVIVITDGYGAPAELQGTQDRWIWKLI